MTLSVAFVGGVKQMRTVETQFGPGNIHQEDPMVDLLFSDRSDTRQSSYQEGHFHHQGHLHYDPGHMYSKAHSKYDQMYSKQGKSRLGQMYVKLKQLYSRIEDVRYTPEPPITPTDIFVHPAQPQYEP